MPEHIVDTGPLVGWINRRDQWHRWSVSVMQALEPPLITCESVIVWSGSDAIHRANGRRESSIRT